MTIIGIIYNSWTDSITTQVMAQMYITKTLGNDYKDIILSIAVCNLQLRYINNRIYSFTNIMIQGNQNL